MCPGINVPEARVKGSGRRIDPDGSDWKNASCRGGGADGATPRDSSCENNRWRLPQADKQIEPTAADERRFCRSS